MGNVCCVADIFGIVGLTAKVAKVAKYEMFGNEFSLKDCSFILLLAFLASWRFD